MATKDNGWIKLHKKILDWEWYDDINTTRLFVHLLLKANFEDRVWHGEEIKRGSLISSISKLSEETGLTAQNIRTSISRLKSTGEITSKSTNNYTVFSITCYESHQANQQADQQAANKRLTTTKEYKEIKEEIEKIYMSFVDGWNNRVCPKAKLPKIQIFSDSRKKELLARLSELCKLKQIEMTVDCVDVFFDCLSESYFNSSFLRGETQHNFVMDIDFVLQKKSFIKILEGKYNDK